MSLNLSDHHDGIHRANTGTYTTTFTKTQVNYEAVDFIYYTSRGAKEIAPATLAALVRFNYRSVITPGACRHG